MSVTPHRERQTGSTLCKIPTELFHRIVLWLIDLTGSLRDVSSLLCTCDEIWNKLDFANNYYLWGCIHAHRFDTTAAYRRGYHDFDYRAQAWESLHKSNLLKEINGWTTGKELSLDTLRRAYIMMLEDDGKNRALLIAAGMQKAVDHLCRTTLWANRVNNWPVDDEYATLLLWMVWFLTTKEDLARESPQQRAEIMHLVFPFVVSNCRYPSQHCPVTHFEVPFSAALNPGAQSMPTPHGEYPRRHTGECVVVDGFYQTTLEFALPLISEAAKLVWFSRNDMTPRPNIPWLPATRAQAIQQNRTGPTQEDINELNAYGSTKLPHIPGTDWADALDDVEWALETRHGGRRATKASSLAFDNNWNRITHCIDPQDPSWTPLTYTFGGLSGLWHGHILFPNNAAVMALVQSINMPDLLSVDTMGIVSTPVFFRLKEYHCASLQRPIPCLHNAARTAMNTWFAGGTRNFETAISSCDTADGLRLETSGRAYYYDTYDPERPSSHDRQACEHCQADDAYEQQEMRTRLRQQAAEQYESMFESVGLGAPSDDDDDDNDDAMEEDQLEGRGDPDRAYYGRNKCDGVTDIYLTGSMDEKHAQAWGNFDFIGRVRRWDGLIGIVRLSPAAPGSNIFMYGYLHGADNFVGNWRIATTDLTVPGWECAFSMSRRD